MGALDLLLLGIPVAFFAEYFLHNPLIAFIASAAAVIRLAGWMGHATEQAAIHMGPRIGGFLNGSLGNAAELIIVLAALRHGQHELVKASLSGSIIGNGLLVFGAAVLAGGLRYPAQTFNKTLASFNSSLMLIAVGALVVPAVFHSSAPAIADEHMPLLSLITAVVLLAIYVLSLFFSFRTHAHLFHTAGGHSEHAEWSKAKAFGVLLVTTVFVVFMSEIMVASAEPVLHQLGLSELFLGAVALALIGNAAEHSSAITLALKGEDITTSVEIAIGSTTQIALLVAPLAVILSWLWEPMSLQFIPAELVSIIMSVFLVKHISSDGETNWVEGVMLVGAYLIIAVGFFFVPA